MTPSPAAAHPAAPPWHPAAREAGREVRDDVHHVTLSPPGAAREARANITGILAAWRITGAVADTARLLATELATNAEKFSAGEISMTTWRLPGLLAIEITDQSPELPARRAAGPGAVSGRGLNIVAELSEEWGCYPPGPGRKTVFCVLAAPGPRDQGEGIPAAPRGRDAGMPGVFPGGELPAFPAPPPTDEKGAGN